MSTTFELGGLVGEHIDGPAHLETAVDVELERRDEGIVLTQTAMHPATPDRAVRCELDRSDAADLRDELDQLLAD